LDSHIPDSIHSGVTGGQIHVTIQIILNYLSQALSKDLASPKQGLGKLKQGVGACYMLAYGGAIRF